MQEIVEVLEVEPKASWSLAKLSDLYSFVIGGDWGKGPDEDLDADYEKVYCIRGSELRNWKQEKGSSASLRKVKSSSLTKRKLEIGDIILEISGGGPEQPVGRTALIDEDVLAFEPNTPKVCTNFLRLLRLTSQVDSKYINYYLTFFYYTGEVVKYQGGSNNLRNLKFDEYSDINVPLPPLAEQKRIVAKLDALMEKVEAARERLEAIPETLKQFRQRVLAHAVSGKLTEEWRRGNPEVESAQALLENIKNKRVKLYQDACRKAAIKGVRKPKMIDFGTPYVHQLKSWITTSIKDVFSVETGATPLRGEDRYWAGGNIPWIKSGQVQNCEIFEADEFITEEAVNETNVSLFPKGSLLIAMYGEGKTRGQVGRLMFEATTNQAIAALVNRNLESVVVDYVFLFALSQYNEIREQAAGGNQPNLNLEKIKNWQIPLPPLPEQKEIVRKIEELFAWADGVEDAYNRALEKLEKLPQALLAKAFRGELVPQDASDEPASVLLALIQSVQEGQKKGRGGKAA